MYLGLNFGHNTLVSRVTPESIKVRIHGAILHAIGCAQCCAQCCTVNPGLKTLFFEHNPTNRTARKKYICRMGGPYSEKPWPRSGEREPSHLFRIWIKVNYIYRACFVFCGRHFEFLIRAHGLLVRGLEPKIRKSLGACSEPARSLLGAMIRDGTAVIAVHILHYFEGNLLCNLPKITLRDEEALS